MSFSNFTEACKRSVFVIYILIQGLVVLTLTLIGCNMVVHLSTAAITVLLYFFVSLKNPGYYEEVNTHASQKSTRSRKSSAKSRATDQISEISNAVRGKKNRSPSAGRKQNIELSNEQEYRGRRPQDRTNRMNQQNSEQTKRRKEFGVDKANEGVEINNIVAKDTVKTKSKSECCIGQKLSPEDLLKQQKFQTDPQSYITQKKVVIRELQLVERYCLSCHHEQPLRVRHCEDCKRCVSTFDHHCPWMNNCIGQKNHLIFILYMVSQIIEIGAIVAELIGMVIRPDNLHHHHIIWNVWNIEVLVAVVGLSAFGVVIFLLLLFQMYFISLNITTWQFLRWTRIEYLTIFDHKKINSIFSHGIVSNWVTFVKMAYQKKRKVWENSIHPEAANCLIKYDKQERKANTMTDRILLPKA